MRTLCRRAETLPHAILQHGDRDGINAGYRLGQSDHALRRSLDQPLAAFACHYRVLLLSTKILPPGVPYCSPHSLVNMSISGAPPE